MRTKLNHKLFDIRRKKSASTTHVVARGKQAADCRAGAERGETGGAAVVAAVGIGNAR